MLKHLSLTDIALLCAAVTYVVLQVKDFRPINALRRENIELRQALDELREQHAGLEKRYQVLERSRNFEASFEVIVKAIDADRARHEQMIAAFDEHSQETARAWIEIQRGLAANTTALAALAAGLHAA